jgi:S-adenosylmethionine:tRNA-ribosyltransferase-isomerase (queuine synthetase)
MSLQFKNTYALLEQRVEKRFEMITKRIKPNTSLVLNSTKVIYLKNEKGDITSGSVLSVRNDGTILFNMNKGKVKQLNYHNIVMLEDKISLVEAMNMII